MSDVCTGSAFLQTGQACDRETRKEDSKTPMATLEV